jgi:hypothetical protein
MEDEIRSKEEIEKELNICYKRLKELKSAHFTTTGQILALEWVLKKRG